MLNNVADGSRVNLFCGILPSHLNRKVLFPTDDFRAFLVTKVIPPSATFGFDRKVEFFLPFISD
jgi:hypothetical protein